MAAKWERAVTFLVAGALACAVIGEWRGGRGATGAESPGGSGCARSARVSYDISPSAKPAAATITAVLIQADPACRGDRFQLTLMSQQERLARVSGVLDVRGGARPTVPSGVDPSKVDSTVVSIGGD